MIQFYAPDILKNPILPESDSQHCIRVLRKQQGDIIDVIDGCGHRLKCRIIDPHSKRTLLEVVEIEEGIHNENSGVKQNSSDVSRE